jgi:hypothetical protein
MEPRPANSAPFKVRGKLDKDLLDSRGNQSGSEIDDWLQAEEEIRRAEEEAIDKR